MGTDIEIPAGYKNSALGIIPLAWEVKRLGEIAKLTSGTTPLRANDDYFKDGDIPWVKTTDLNNGKLSVSEEMVTQKALNETSLKILPRGTVLVAMYGGFNQIGRTALLNINASINQALCALLIDNRNMSSEYILMWLNHNVGYWKNFAASSRKDPNITSKDVSHFPILVPPLEEQKRIAEVLGVWDRGIELQSELVERLTRRKHALMQQLLTARKRLPNFTAPWQTTNLGELFKERNEAKCNNLPLLSITADLGVIPQSDSDKKDTSNEDKSKYKRICKGDIGYNTMRMWQGRSALSNLEGIISPAYTVVTPNKYAYPTYFAYLFKTPYVIYKFWTHSQGLVSDTLNCKYHDFATVVIDVPNIAEQKAIAEVLMCADREIEIATRKLAELRNQKRGLMQQLLTGKKQL